MQEPVKLGYWQIRGLSERIRMIMEYLSIPYEMVTYNQDTSQKWFKEIKPELIKKNPAVTLPYLIDGDKVITESNAICVYLVHKGNRADLTGRNAEEKVMFETVMGVLKDFHTRYVRFSYGSDGEADYDKAKEKVLQDFKPNMKKLQGLLGEKDYYCGEITWADFAVSEFMNCLWLLDQSIFDDSKNVLDHMNRIWELPAIKAYHGTDRFNERPLNNFVARFK